MRRSTFVGAPLLVLMLVPALPSAAASQLYKCVDGGRTVYQQQACRVTAETDASASGVHAAAKSASEPAAKAATRLKPPSPPASTALATPR
jgi:uncharacterized protein DUF4124